ncbi:beta-glucosidase [Demequina sp. NBRC 110056]|uniref:beta-glucosidase family protein n=1 Tax=Demequina sp. NBRC 110056 TaxID=1570345 RepID=UPI0009FF759B|nr:glycoside hydrolase family 3 C-terminal domain-containing protein [Demequina sp. NBRC 110056]
MTSSQSAAPATLDASRALAAALPLERQVELLTGATMWRLIALPELGARSVTFSDGPVGVRGIGEREGETSILFPTPSAMAAAWDPELARTIGQGFAQEAREHGVDVVLAPQVNLQRTPVGGRHFECFSEDPLLTSVIGSAVVEGLQQEGVAACMKHFIANDSETERTSYTSVVDERVLREVYLAPFEAAVQAGLWSLMAAYNGVDDGAESATMTEHRHLTVDVLKGDLGFDGVVVSDWEATRRAAQAARGGLDLVMPGPGGPWAEGLLAAVHEGLVSPAEIEDKVARVLLLAARVGAFGSDPAATPEHRDLRVLVRDVAARSTVALRAVRGHAPWERPAPRSIALVGSNAQRPHVLGGGSSTVHPAHVVTPLEGLAARWPDARIVVERGGDTRAFAPRLDLDGRSNGLHVTWFDARGDVLGRERVVEHDGWLREIPDGAVEAELACTVALAEPGAHQLSVGTVGVHSTRIDGAVASASDVSVGVDCILDSSANNPDCPAVEVAIEAPREVAILSRHEVVDAAGYGRFVRAELRHALPRRSDDEEIADAVRAAAAADLAVVVVGTNEESESEGWDRITLALPGRQDELVERVLEEAPDAVIVVNAGAPVLLPWLERARTVLWAWFPGQEAGHALADVLAGEVEPEGRLPWTLPARDSDVPVPHAIPQDGVVAYTDGLDVGYRAWERSGAVPAGPFGHGLGWTDWSHRVHAGPRIGPDGAVELDVEVTNTGERRGREVVQVYVEGPEDGPERPVRWLGGFAAVSADAGEAATATVRLAARVFEVWDVQRQAWILPEGEYRLRVGRSVRDIRADAVVRLGASETTRRSL